MWCSVSDQHVVVGRQPDQPRPAAAARVAGRTGGARLLGQAARTSSSSRRPASTHRQRDVVRACTMPARRGRPPRRTWCAATRAARPARSAPACSAATSSAPRSRSAERRHVLGAVRLELVQEPQPLLGERQRQRRRRAATTGIAASAPAALGPRRQQRRPARRRSGAVNSARGDNVARRTPRAAGRSPGCSGSSRRRGRRSCRRTPTRSTPEHLGPDLRRAARSASVRGATYSAPAAAKSGAGSARRSSLPLAVSGSASSATNAAGTM